MCQINYYTLNVNRDDGSFLLRNMLIATMEWSMRTPIQLQLIELCIFFLFFLLHFQYYFLSGDPWRWLHHLYFFFISASFLVWYCNWVAQHVSQPHVYVQVSVSIYDIDRFRLMFALNYLIAIERASAAARNNSAVLLFWHEPRALFTHTHTHTPLRNCFRLFGYYLGNFGCKNFISSF